MQPLCHTHVRMWAMMKTVWTSLAFAQTSVAILGTTFSFKMSKMTHLRTTVATLRSTVFLTQNIREHPLLCCDASTCPKTLQGRIMGELVDFLALPVASHPNQHVAVPNETRAVPENFCTTRLPKNPKCTPRAEPHSCFPRHKWTFKHRSLVH